MQISSKRSERSLQQMIQDGMLFRLRRENDFQKIQNVTDMLYACYESAANGEDFSEQLDNIHARYQEIIDGLNLDFSLDLDFVQIKENFSNKAGADYAASRGECLNGKIMAAYLGFEFVDAAEVVRFNDDGSFNDEVTNTLLS